MILPIVAYGDPVLRKPTEDLDKDYPGLAELIENMFETMYNASGIGLAAPQLGLPIRLFIVDSTSLDEDEKSDEKGVIKVFINATIVTEDGIKKPFEEGCLSIPFIREDVFRKQSIVIEYYDENFNLKEESFNGLNARIIQHEYDHLEGILFTDLIKPLKKRLLKKKLQMISRGEVDVPYKMKFPLLKVK